MLCVALVHVMKHLDLLVDVRLIRNQVGLNVRVQQFIIIATLSIIKRCCNVSRASMAVSTAHSS